LGRLLLEIQSNELWDKRRVVFVLTVKGLSHAVIIILDASGNRLYTALIFSVWPWPVAPLLRGG
jgi:hypothetical protein